MNRHPLRSFFLLPLLGLTGCLATHGAPADPVPPPPTLRAGELPDVGGPTIPSGGRCRLKN